MPPTILEFPTPLMRKFKSELAFTPEVLERVKNMKLNSYHKFVYYVDFNFGAHTGIVGSKMPRYCLFGNDTEINSKLIKNFFNCKTEISQLYSSTGDTINVASRMESTGEGKNTFPNSTTALSSFKFPLRQLQKSTSHPR